MHVECTLMQLGLGSELGLGLDVDVHGMHVDTHRLCIERGGNIRVHIEAATKIAINRLNPSIDTLHFTLQAFHALWSSMAGASTPWSLVRYEALHSIIP